MAQAHSISLSELVSCAFSTIPICPFFNSKNFSFTCRIAGLLDLPLFEKDGLSEHICEKCKRRLERLAVEVSHNLDWLLVTARSLRGACVFLRSAVAPYTQAHCGEEPGVRGYRLLVTFT